MADPAPEAPDDALLRRYLLGDATPEELERVERHLFADLDGLERIEAAEGDLLDACARGELPAAEREKVVARLARTPAGRARLALSRDLIHLAEFGSETHPIFAPPRAPEAPRRAPALWALLAAALAGLAVVVAGGWLAHRPAAQPAPTVAARPAPARVPPVAAIPRPGDGVAPRAPGSAVATAVCELSLATERGGAAEPRLRLAPGTERVELRLALDEGESYRAYRVTLRARGRTVARAEGLAARRTAAGPRIVLMVPAADLRQGRYEVAVQGESGKGALEDVGSQELLVIR